MVEFLYKKNVNAEGATLEASVVADILSLLENGSLVEAVRVNLSEKKKMKDLFLVVIKSIDITRNRKLVASLIQFVSNLCYGTGKFRKMLLAADSNPKEFLALLRSILTTVEQPDFKDPEALVEETKSDPELKRLLANEGERVLLKQSLITFVGNLCCETQLRQMIAQDAGELLT